LSSLVVRRSVDDGGVTGFDVAVGEYLKDFEGVGRHTDVEGMVGARIVNGETDEFLTLVINGHDVSSISERLDEMILVDLVVIFDSEIIDHKNESELSRRIAVDAWYQEVFDVTLSSKNLINSVFGETTSVA
jgi:hypothetical protein